MIDKSKICMVDIETLDITPTAVILSIGACDLNGDEKFYIIPAHNQPGRTCSPETVDWWMTQPAGVYPRESNIVTPKSLLGALITFDGWYTSQGFTEIWCKGTDFDIAILTQAYKFFGTGTPWKYNEVRDMRTVLKLYESMTGVKVKDHVGPNGQAHNALGDALYQAAQLRVVFENTHFFAPPTSGVISNGQPE